MSTMTAVGQWSGVMMSSLTRMKSPGCRSGNVLSQWWHCWRLWR